MRGGFRGEAHEIAGAGPEVALVAEEIVEGDLIESDPNRIDDPGYIVRLVGQVITVSVETVKLVNTLAQAVKVEDWLGEAVEMKE